MKKLAGITFIALTLSFTGFAQDNSEPKPLSLEQLVKIKTGFRQTLSKLTLSKKEIQEILWQGSFLFFDVKPLKKPIEEVMKRYGINNIILDAKPTSELLTLELSAPTKLVAFTNLPIQAAAKVSITDIRLQGKKAVAFFLKGFSYSGAKVKAFYWHEELGAYLYLEDNTQIPFNINELKEFHKKHEADLAVAEEKNTKEKRPAVEIALSIVAFIYRFTTSTPDNQLHIALDKNQVFTTDIRNWLKKTVGEKPLVHELIDNVVDLTLTNKGLVVNLTDDYTVESHDNLLDLRRRMTFQMFTKEVVTINGILAGKVEGTTSRNITNLSVVKPNAEFPKGALRFGIRATRRTVIYREFDFNQSKVVRSEKKEVPG